MQDLIERQAAIDALNVGAELLRRVLDDADIVGAERAKYEWGLGLIESYISDMKEIPFAQPDGVDLFPNISEEYKKGYRDGLCDKSEFNAELTQINANQCVGSVEYDDVVSRQAAIDALERKKDKNAKGDIGGFYNKIIQNNIDAIMQLPPAQPDPSQCFGCNYSKMELFGQLAERLKELKQLRAEKDFSDSPDLESYKKGFIDGFNEGYKARERDAN